jgi:hypothetical protein
VVYADGLADNDSTRAAKDSSYCGQPCRPDLFLPAAGKEHKYTHRSKHKEKRLANRSPAHVKCSLPILSHNAGKAEDKGPGPKYGCTTGGQGHWPFKTISHVCLVMMVIELLCQIYLPVVILSRI